MQKPVFCVLLIFHPMHKSWDWVVNLFFFKLGIEDTT